MEGSEFVFDYVCLLQYNCHKINPNRSGSYEDSPGWIKTKKVTIKPINKKDTKCFQYTVTVALEQEEIKLIKGINYCQLMYFDPAKRLSAPGLAWQAALKRTNVKLR